MAELIPLEYRVSVARKKLIRRWLFAGGVVVAAAVAGLVYTHLWERKQSQAYVEMQKTYDRTVALLRSARELQASRDALAAKMARIERLKNDSIVLTMVRNVSSAFGDNDCLKFIRVDAHLGDPKAEEQRYQVQIHGITKDSTTHTNLLDRLTDIGRKSNPPLKVNLGEKHTNKVNEVEVTFFDLTCEPLPLKNRTENAAANPQDQKAAQAN